MTVERTPERTPLVIQIEKALPRLAKIAKGKSSTAFEYVKNLKSNVRLYKKNEDEKYKLALLAVMQSNLYWLERALKTAD